VTVENLQDQASEVSFPYYQRKARDLIQKAYNLGMAAVEPVEVSPPEPRKRRRTIVAGTTAESEVTTDA
jgi:hypothetical protein